MTSSGKSEDPRAKAALVGFDEMPDGYRWDSPPKIKVAPDSPLEGDGFELSVPGRETVKPSWETGLLSRKRERICWGTEGSNPSPSSGESRANLKTGRSNPRQRVRMG